ncbi:MAG: glycosyltransferase family 8 protein [Bacteroidaceae bacterium]|jgi:lipopolysaccharide biosynthesis glycosyltransferase
MDIVICTDNNYVMPSGVLICSICENNKTEKIRFHIVGNETLSDESKQSLSEISGSYHQEIHFYCADDSLNSLLPVGKERQPKHITVAAYYRLFLASILPANIDKVLYLDCDIIVRHNLNELWNTDITDYAVGCVTDGSDGLISYYNRLRYPQFLGYFNSGVLLINLAYWRRYKVQDESLDFLKKYPERIQFHDQDVLNYVLREKKKALPFKYNVQDGFLREKLDLSWEYEEELEEAIRDPWIIHYCGGKKPWTKGCTHPFKSDFFKYRQLTKWRNRPLLKCDVKPIIKRKVRVFLGALGVMSKAKLNNYRNDIKLPL